MVSSACARSMHAKDSTLRLVGTALCLQAEAEAAGEGAAGQGGAGGTADGRPAADCAGCGFRGVPGRAGQLQAHQPRGHPPEHRIIRQEGAVGTHQYSLK